MPLRDPSLRCPSAELLREQLDGRLTREESALLFAHLDRCAACLGRLALLARDRQRGAAPRPDRRRLDRCVNSLVGLLSGDPVAGGWILVSGGTEEARAALLARAARHLEEWAAGNRSLWERLWEARRRARPRLVRYEVETQPTREAVIGHLRERMATWYPKAAAAGPCRSPDEIFARISLMELGAGRRRMIVLVDQLDRATLPSASVLPASLPSGVLLLCLVHSRSSHLGWLRTRPGLVHLDLDEDEADRG